MQALREKLAPDGDAAALNQAARLTLEARYPEALQVLSAMGGGFRKGRGGYAPAQIIPLLFREIICAISGSGRLASPQVQKRNRVLKLVSLAALPFFAAMHGGGSLLSRAGFSAGKAVADFADALRTTGWVHGLPVQPDFVAECLQLEEMEGFRRSLTVYRDVFADYLDYWLEGGYAIGDLILASVKPADAHALYCLVREKAPVTALEIGTFVGFSTSMIATAMRDAGKGRLYCIDPGIPHLSVDSPLTHAAAMLARQGLDDRITFLKGFFSDPRATIAGDQTVFGRTLADIVPRVDLAFIDGDHAAAAVIQDFTLLLPWLNDQAMVIFHDVRSWTSVREGLLVLMQDADIGRRVRYRELSPAGLDGIGIMEVRR